MIAETIAGPHNPGKGGRGGGEDGNGWQMDGWVRWLEGLRGQYERRMQTMCSIFEEGKEIVKAGRFTKGKMTEGDMDEWSIVEKIQIYDFAWPLGGMFVWLRMNFESHPLWPQYKDEPEQFQNALWVHLTADKFLVLVAPGQIFAPTEEIKREKSWRYFRVCFAAVDEGEVERTSRRFVAGVREFWGKKNVDDIEELVTRGCQDEGLVDMRGAC